jgi:hypothetical protein
MTPTTSDDLTTLVTKQDDAFVVLYSLETAEHDPDYCELGRFSTEQQAVQFLSQDR